VSQPYLFRLFGTKRDLFLAAVERGFDRVQLTFQRAAAADPDNPLKAMGKAYGGLLEHREELLVQMQAYAACGDPEVQVVVRRRFGELYHCVKQASDAGPDDLRDFFAAGMLLNVAAAMDLPSIVGEDWARECLDVQL
jgi:AcrR family transcriptional regulator